MPQEIVTSPSEQVTKLSAFAPAVSRAVWVAGVIYLIGSIVDLGILWLGQRQPGLQWEFVAVSSTVEAWPRMVLGVGLIYAGVYIGGSVSNLLYRGLALVTVLLGLAAVALGGLMALNYLSVLGNIQPEAISIVRSSVIKTEILCGLYAVLLIPIGVWGLLGAKTHT